MSTHKKYCAMNCSVGAGNNITREQMMEGCEDCLLIPTAMQSIPIFAAFNIAERYNYDQVIIIARKVGLEGGEHMTTYGAGKAHSDVAARAGRYLQEKVMKWFEESVQGEVRDRDVEKDWTRWSDIVMPNGVIDIEQVKRELSDFSMILEGLPELLMYVTGGKCSMPNTHKSVIKSLHDEMVEKRCEEAVEDFFEDVLPAAWYRGVVSHTAASDPPEYDVDMAYGEDRPEGDGWIALYRKPL